jgi:hypothetical protein
MTNDLHRVIARPSVDAEYRFGQPKMYLAPHELARLTILRSRLGDTQAERASERIPERTACGSGGLPPLHECAPVAST